jgi:anti-anti-sigma regulatory factor
MLKIQRTMDRNVVFTLSGRLNANSLGDLSALIAEEHGGPALVLDLKDLVLVDREAVRFLRACEGDGVMLRNCPPYIRAWMAREGRHS